MNKKVKEEFMNSKTYKEASEIGKKYKLYNLDEEMERHLNILLDNESNKELDINIPR